MMAILRPYRSAISGLVNVSSTGSTGVWQNSNDVNSQTLMIDMIALEHQLTQMEDQQDSQYCKWIQKDQAKTHVDV